MRSFSKLEKLIMRTFFEIGAIQFGEFKLKLHERNPNAPLSPIYLNLRTPTNPKPGPLTPEVLKLCAVAMKEKVASLGLQYDLLCPIPNAGNDFAEAYTDLFPGNREDYLVRLRKIEADGKRCVVADQPNLEKTKGRRVLPFDDLISEADTKNEAIDAIVGEAIQGIVEDLMVLVDRCQGGVDVMAKRGVRVVSILDLPDILTFYAEEGLIAPATELQVRAYLKL